MGNQSTTPVQPTGQDAFESTIAQVKMWQSELQQKQLRKMSDIQSMASEAIVTWSPLLSYVGYMFIGLGILAVIVIAVVVALVRCRRNRQRIPETGIEGGVTVISLLEL